MNEMFRHFAARVSALAGTSWAFLTATLAILLWAVTGPFFQYSSNWQLIINTGPTIITFLMVFLIQNAQNREALATQLKLDELIRAMGTARNSLVNIERLSDEELLQLKGQFERLQQQHAVHHEDALSQDPEPTS
jgi:low affinity Fe/Cu permease